MSVSLYQTLFCDLVFFIGFLSLFKVIQRRRVSRFQVMLCVVSLALICLFPFITGDYYHYQELFLYMKSGGETNNLEPIFEFFTDISPTYFSFRFIIWGSAILLLLITFKFTKIDFAVALFLFFVRNFITFSYPRVSLAMALLFCGMAFISTLLNRKYFYPILGAIMIFFSAYFHKSAIFGVGVCILSLFIVRPNKTKLFIAILMIPVFIYGLSSMLDVFILEDLSENELMLWKGQDYIEGHSTRYNSSSKNIIDLIWRVPYYLIVIMYVKLIVSKRYTIIPTTIMLFANAAVIAIIISFMFLINPSVFSFIIFYRLLNFSMIPALVFVTYCFSNKIYPELVKSFYYLSLLGVTLNLAYKTIVLL